MRPVGAPEDLLLFRAVADPTRRALTAQWLDGAVPAHPRPNWVDADLWELSDATCGPDEEPVAVAATFPLGDGRRVKLVAIAVAPAMRGRGLGQRAIEDLADALRARGVLALVTAVPSDQAAAIVVVQRAGLRPSHVERAGPDGDEPDLVWFDVGL